MREIELRNLELLDAWQRKRQAGATFPDPWPPVARAWLDRYLNQQRLLARQFVCVVHRRKLARERAVARWFHRGQGGARW